MNVDVKIIYNEKEFSDIDDVILELLINNIKKSLSIRVEPFIEDILASGGSVAIVITGNSLETIKGELQIDNVPPDLSERFMLSLK
jgi:hypothetical protein